MKDILEMNREEILALNPGNVPHKMIRQQVEHIFSLLQAYWKHDGDFSKPHVKLTSGNHSNGYINCPAVLNHENLRLILANQILFDLRIRKIVIPETWASENWVIGSDTSATALAKSIADLLGCRHGILEKGPKPKKLQIWKNQVIQPGEKVLHIEELMTTAFTAKRVREGIKDGNPHPVEFVEVIPVLMHRSKEYFVDGEAVLDIFHFNIENWTPNECPYCANNSPVLENPKENWAKLTG